jgi:RNA polymerase sigma-B factor
MRTLSERDRRVVYLRFFEERSQSEIGRSLGVTQMQVSRLLTRIMRDLRRQVIGPA